ncbi:hypothetical protein [Streptomyces roseoverticillatus]|uniref:hypothetical protein n=1 Tax=Streptomyces roseoverticillatus TaxID=66429 RepID=UPI0004C2586B|nr:hypothetical protein [Streptomyces roseoverticillatus]
MIAKTIGEHGAAIKALNQLLHQFPHLPASTVRVSTLITPAGIGPGIEVTPASLTDFEVWREALNVEPEAVEWSSELLSVHARFAGADVTVHATAKAVTW